MILDYETGKGACNRAAERARSLEGYLGDIHQPGQTPDASDQEVHSLMIRSRCRFRL